MTHLVPAILALPGLILLVTWSYNKPWHCAWLSVFGVSLIACYGISAAYHGLVLARPESRKLQRMDHAGVLFFIAGSVTPVCTIVISGLLGFILAVLVWRFTFSAILYIFLQGRISRAYLAPIFIVLGGIVVVPYPILLERLGRDGFDLLVGGALLYFASGIVFHFRVKHCLKIAHALQVCASIFHFVLYGWYVLPLNT